MRPYEQIKKDYLSKKTSVKDLVQESLKIAAKNRHNSVITALDQYAQSRAKAADHQIELYQEQAFNKKPLLGLTVGLKDNLNLLGQKTTCASKILENYIAPYSATAVQRLEDNGAVFVAKLNMDEFAMGGSSENSYFGPVLNPVDLSFVAGGSSGGSAAAVAEGLCTVALGSDTGGSVRLPASFCGVYGFKPTYGRISRFGLVSYASSLDQIGILANNAQDILKVFDSIKGHDPKDATSLSDLKSTAKHFDGDFTQLRVGVPKQFLTKSLDPQIHQKIELVLEVLKKRGVKIIDLDWTLTPYAVAAYYIIAMCEASANLSRYDGVRFGLKPLSAQNANQLSEYYKLVRSQFGKEVQRRILLGTYALSSGYYEDYYLKACKMRRALSMQVTSSFDQVDVILGPVSPVLPFKLGSKLLDPLQMYMVDALTVQANLVGLPAMSIPLSKSVEGLPIGLQLMCAQNKDEYLISLGQSLAGALNDI